MAEVKAGQLKKDIEAKKFRPIYALHGEEPYYIDRLASLIEEHCLTEAEKGFNQHILYGKDTDHKTLLDTCMRYPMMSERQLVILREAHAMRDLEDIQPYIEKPAQTTVLVICYRGKKLDGRKKFTKDLAKHGVVYYSAPVRDYQMPDWIEGYAKSKGFGMEKKTAALLEEYLGTDLSKVAGSLDKMAMNLVGEEMITPDHVQKFIGISKDYNMFELNNALLKHDQVKAHRVTSYFAANPKAAPLFLLIGALYGTFSKLYMMPSLNAQSDKELAQELGVHPFFVRDYKAATKHYSPKKVRQVIGLLHRYDIRSKGVDNAGTSDGELLQELVWQILN